MPRTAIPTQPDGSRLVAILVALGATAFLLERIGFGLTMFVMNVVVLWALGNAQHRHHPVGVDPRQLRHRVRLHALAERAAAGGRPLGAVPLSLCGE